MAQIQLEIVTPEKITFSDTVDFVALPGREGELGVLPGHMPLITELQAGELRFNKGGEVEHLAVSGGFAQINPSKVVVLAETAELAGEIDAHRAQMAASAKGEKLKAGKLPPDQQAEIQASLVKELVRLKVAEKLKVKRRP